MKKFRIGLMIIATILMIIHLAYIDYHNLSWAHNESPYIGIISNICLLTSLILTNYDIKNNPKISK